MVEDGSTELQEVAVVDVHDIEMAPSIAPDELAGGGFTGDVVFERAVAVVAGRSVLNSKLMT